MLWNAGRRAGWLFILIALVLPLPAQAHHRDRYMKLALSNCSPTISKTASVDKKDEALDCAIPFIREQRGKGLVINDDFLSDAADARNAAMVSCGIGPKPCGHGLIYHAQQAHYFSDLSCDTVAEAYQRFPKDASVKRMLSLLLHHARYSRLLIGGRWRNYASTLSEHNNRLYLNIVFGRRCADADPVPKYQKPPIDLLPPAEDSLANEKNNGTFKYHAIYVWGSDQPNRFGKFRDQINRDIFNAAALPIPLYEKQRSVRFDFNAATSTSPESVDITGQQLPFTQAELTDDAGFVRITDFFKATWDWRRPNLGRHKNLLVFVDAEDSGACGRAPIPNHSSSRDPLANPGNNQFQLATIYINPETKFFCDSRAIRHEVGHTLGALLPIAPNTFDGAHCNDALEDPMCYDTYIDNWTGLPQWSPERVDEYPQQANREAYWDFGQDDYWDPVGKQLPWWTTNLSRFVCSDAACAPDGSDLIGF